MTSSSWSGSGVASTPTANPQRVTTDNPVVLRDPVEVVVLDVDGTLIDSNYQHAIAWHRAFRSQGVAVPVWRLHRQIGTGGDRFVADVAGQEVEDAHGDAVREVHTHEFDALIDEVEALEGATELLAELRRRGLRVVLASSGQPKHIDRFAEVLGAPDLDVEWTRSGDADESKPAPDLIEVALDRVGGGRALMIGDATWDFRAAKQLDLPTVGLLTGGISEAELRAAGADTVYPSLRALMGNLAAELGG
ncbi:MAG TPA: HAD family hydrolase [Nocardioidaceae bacterium]|jgi:HAD superfamily hydrolase (TIGR01549 family)|nr:HAD family hydrolase [Nocardioidaceae bacterium]